VYQSYDSPLRCGFNVAIKGLRATYAIVTDVVRSLSVVRPMLIYRKLSWLSDASNVCVVFLLFFHENDAFLSETKYIMPAYALL